MQTILSEKKSDVGSPYVYYTLEVETSNRTATQVDVQVTIKSHLQYSSSYLANGTLEGFFEFQGGQNRSIVIKSLSDTFSGTTEYTVSNTFTLNASASQTSITCKFKVDGSRGSGTLYELNTSDITIPIGHNKPVISSYSITETNPLLVSAGVSNNTFVANLSIKSFNIIYTLYDGATLYRGGIGNAMKKMYYNPTLPFSIDFRQNALYLDENNKVPIWVIIDDLYLGQYTRTAFTNAGTTPGGSIIYDAYDYINYIPISLIETNTTAKRDGQVSGKVNLNISGTYYNGVVGNVDQTSYKPTIKYKFWRNDESEPISYSYTIPSANITISNGTFSVTDYAIGSTNTSATNYFNPDYAYKVKIEVDDNFSTYYSIEKSIPVGEATWTEYPDHVDFKKITIGGYEILESGVSNSIYYEKRSDGVAICYGSVSLTSNDSRSQGGLTYYSASTTVNLPVTFTNTNYMYGFSNVIVANMNRFCQSYVTIEGTNQIQVLYTNTTYNEKRTINYLIIGKWK